MSNAPRSPMSTTSLAANLRRLLDASVISLRWIGRRKGAAIAITAVVLVGWQLTTSPIARRIASALSLLVSGAVGSIIALHAVDGPATLRTIAAALAKLLLGWAPAIVLARSVPERRIWVVLGGLYTLPMLPFTLRACPTPAHWIALVALSVAGMLLVRRRFLRVLALLPLIELIFVPYLSHGWDLVWKGPRLEARCAHNDGRRPTNLTPEKLAPAYFGIHTLADGSLLLTGEGVDDGRLFGVVGGGTSQTGSWLLRHHGDALEIAGPAEIRGNLWNSCTLKGETWLPRAGRILGITPGAGAPTVRTIRIPMEGFDAAGIACDPRSGKVLVMEALYGYIWEVSPDTGALERGAVSTGVGGLMKFRPSDGQLVIMQPNSLSVYAPAERRVVHRIRSGIAQMGFDICPLDGSLVTADFAGRVRVFSEDATDGYRFSWGVSLFAPRRVAFSPDCTRIAVTSGDDEHVWIIDRAQRQVDITYSVGPSIRGIAFLSNDDVGVADACTVTSLPVRARP
ncbi:Hypothetical protein A7982_05189 [Minicystis rosea]|nr:Hypothetical protein A7982_05189 [Minicystis rosea]